MVPRNTELVLREPLCRMAERWMTFEKVSGEIWWYAICGQMRKKSGEEISGTAFFIQSPKFGSLAVQDFCSPFQVRTFQKMLWKMVWSHRQSCRYFQIARRLVSPRTILWDPHLRYAEIPHHPVESPRLMSRFSRWGDSYSSRSCNIRFPTASFFLG